MARRRGLIFQQLGGSEWGQVNCVGLPRKRIRLNTWRQLLRRIADLSPSYRLISCTPAIPRPECLIEKKLWKGQVVGRTPRS
jgi:hypothetical protein